MKPLNVTLVQSNLQWENKAANLQMFEEKIAAVKDRMELVILPEMFSTGFSMNPASLAETMDGPTVSWMKHLAAAKKIILAGSIIVEDEKNYYNRLIWMLPDGQYGFYDKRHLFAFAEEDKYYTPGTKRLVASVKGWRVNLQVCYDLRFPVWARQSNPLNSEMEEPEYDLLVFVANWPEKRSHAWKTLLQARAIENQCYVIGVNRVGIDGKDIYYSGDSMVVDPSGEIIYAKADQEDIHTVSLDPEKLIAVRGKFPFLKDADRFLIGN